jgi:hypothetical protein
VGWRVVVVAAVVVVVVVRDDDVDGGKYRSWRSARARSIRRAMLAGILSKQVMRE